MIRPFIIYALPRSRTAWLSAFLTYRDWVCHHEQTFNLRNLDEAWQLLSRPNTGSAETAAGPGWYLIHHQFPKIRAVVVRRPIDETVRSMKLAAQKALGISIYEDTRIRKGMEYGNRVLDRISEQPDVLTVQFHDLVKEETCRAIFEHCLPYRFDRAWWLALKDQNIQADVGEKIRYYQANRDAIEEFKHHCKRELFRLRRGILSDAVI